ncbi:MAG: HAD family hydrolase [Promethearchaeia archaeon]
MNKEYCIIFDMDGVLADTGTIHYESWVKLAEEIGYKFSREFFEKTFGQQSPEIVRKLVGNNEDPETINKWANLKEKYYRDMVKDKLEPLPGAIELIKGLKKTGFKLALGSSGPPENVYLLLDTLKIKQYFDAIITAADVKNGKPAPDVFLKAAKKTDVKPENCVVIEDAPVGITAAKRAGMKVIALTTTHDGTTLKDADLIIKDLSYVNLEDILKLLK